MNGGNLKLCIWVLDYQICSNRLNYGLAIVDIYTQHNLYLGFDNPIWNYGSLVLYHCSLAWQEYAFIIHADLTKKRLYSKCLIA